MNTEDILIDLNLAERYKKNEDYGYFDTIALVASYNFSYEQYLEDRKRSTPDKPLTELLRTIIHESTHLYQMLSTSYGIYYQSLRLLQTDVVCKIVRLLTQKYKVRLKLPIEKQCRKLIKSREAKDLQILYSEWILAELIIIYFEGDFDGYIKLKNQWSLLQDISTVELFNSIESSLLIYLNNSSRSCNIHNRHKIYDDELSDYLYMGLKSVSFPDVRGIMESWAKVAEYWGIHGVSIEEFYDLFPVIIDAKLADYYYLLSLAKKAIGANTIDQFVFTYMSLCEIALSPPLMPYYVGLRSEKFNLRELNPVFRMQDLLTAVKNIDPIENLEKDYTRFSTEICSKLGWSTPLDIAKKTLDTFKLPEDDILYNFYYKAQGFRAEMPYAFIDLGVWFLPERVYTKDFHYYFSHPVIIFDNHIGRHPDPTVFLYFIERSLIINYIRRIFICEDQKVTFPYKTSQEELNYFISLLQSDLKELLGVTTVYIELSSPLDAAKL